MTNERGARRRFQEDAIPYRLRTNEPAGSGLRRVIVEQLERAAAHLRAPPDPDVAVHEARKAFKRARAALRLARGGYGEARVRAANARVREAARSISRLRDARALLDVGDRLAEHATGARQKAGLVRAHASLAARHQTISGAANGGVSALTRLADDIAALAEEIASWPDRGRAGAVRADHARLYAAGRETFRAAYEDGDTEAFHDWRKRIKDLWYATRLLRDLWPSVLQPVADELNALAELIGYDHDMSVLHAQLADDAGLISRAAERRAVMALIDAQRAQVRVKAWSIGARIYAETREAFAVRTRAYWRARKADDAVARPG